MAIYEVPFSVTLSGTSDTTAATITCANATTRIVNVIMTDEFSEEGDRSISYKITRATSISGGTGTTVTPSPRDNAAASQFTAKVNYSGEPTYTGESVVSNYFPVPAGGAIQLESLRDEAIKAWGTQVLALKFKAAVARSKPITGYALVEE